MTGAEASQAALSIKEPVNTVLELWKNFPDGGSFGWFAFVNQAKTFAYWDIDLEDWVLFSRESNMNSTYVSLLIDAFVESTPTISDYLIGSGKKRFTVQSIVDLFKIPTAFTEAFQTLSQNVDGLSSTISDKQDAIQNNVTLLFVGDCSEGFPNVSSNGELVFDTSTQRLYSSFNIGGLWQWIDIDIRQDTVYVCKKSYYLGNQQSSTLIKLSDGDIYTQLEEIQEVISGLAAEIQTVSAGLGTKSSKISLSAISETAPTGMPPAADLLALCTSDGKLYKSAELSYAPGAYAWEEIQADPQSIYYYGDTTYFVSGGLLKKVGESALAVVNNLEDGGITAPLSAEMGKQLQSSKMDDFSDTIILSSSDNSLAAFVRLGFDFSGKSITNMYFGAEKVLAARLAGAYLEYPNLNGVWFEGCDMSNLYLSSSTFFTGAYLVGCQMQGMQFNGAHLTSSAFFGCDLTGAYLYYVNLDGTNLSGSTLMRADLGFASLADTKLQGVNFTDAVGLDPDINMALAMVNKNPTESGTVWDLIWTDGNAYVCDPNTGLFSII